MDKRERVEINTLDLPDEIAEWIDNSATYESSGLSRAKTVYIDRDGGAYLKIADCGTLYFAAKMQEYFYRYKLSSPVLQYLSTDKDYLITSALDGEDGTSDEYISNPKRLSEVFAQALHFLHNTDISECPAKNKMAEMVIAAKTSPFRQNYLDSIADYIGMAHADRAAEEIERNSRILQNDVLIHGDYCLVNIILKNWNVMGYIDLGDSGIGDRHYDLAQGLRTLSRNLKSSEYGQYFLDAYGRSYIDKDRLRVCSLLASME